MMAILSGQMMRVGGRDSILIFRLGSIGDTVVALPCFHAIARRYHDHRRILLTNTPTMARASSAESILTGSGLIDETIYYPAGVGLRSGIELRRELKRVRPKLTIYLAERLAAVPVYRDLLFFRAAGLSRIVGAPLTGNLRTCRTDPLTHVLEFEAERLARTLAEVVPVQLTAPNWDLRLSDSEFAKAAAAIGEMAAAGPVLAIAPGSKIPAKAWGPENWAALVDSLQAAMRQVALIVVGAPDERALGDDVSKGWSGPVMNLCGDLTPRETAAVLRICRLMVCHDSGPMHLAASQGTPCVALFGNRNRPRQWFPFGTGHRVIYEPRGVRAISVERVANEVRAAFDEHGRRGFAEPLLECGAHSLPSTSPR
jgi:ADP-heptose:LPS heptosyltransferase